MKWRVILEPDPETGDWTVWCPELPGCTSAEESEQEALENIREAIELYLQRDPVELTPGAISREINIGLSGRIRRITAREVESILRQYDFQLISQNGNHRK